MIDAKDLLHGHALSFKNQPSLQTLIEAISDPTVNITFVVGAGLSINAGLPSWGKLLDNICEAIGDPRFAELARSDRSDTLRKSEYSLQLAEALGPSDERSVIRDALYKETHSPRPGPLHNGLARLAYNLRGRARFVTTNYDTLLEQALGDYFPAAEVNDWGPSAIDGWQAAKTIGAADVLHVHGILEPNKVPNESVVFTESHFLSHGPQVRRLISARLQTDVVIFIGVSLTDPNLTSPLWENREASKAHKPGLPVGPFVLTVPDIADPDDMLLSYEFAISKATFFEKKLGALPIFLKSFSQLAQLVWEMTYALEEPTAYTRKAGRDLTQTYGSRFQRVLTKSYSALGAPRNHDFLKTEVAIDSSKTPRASGPTAGPAASGDTADPATALSAALFATLQPKHNLGKHLTKLRRAYPAGTGDSGEEHLGVFLWLRTRSHGNSLASYTATLIGSSAYVNRERWSLPVPVAISATSQYSVSKALYFGSAIAENVGTAEPNPIWRGILAVPLRIEHGGDIHTVGAISLNSTRIVKGSTAEQLSVIGRITDINDYFKLADLLEKAGQDLLLKNWT